MDELDPNNQTNEGVARDDHHSRVARAMASFGIFGAIGMMLGASLGKRANAPSSDVVRPILKWGMGAFWAVVAAYSSLKASDHVQSNTQDSVLREDAQPREIRDDNFAITPASQVQKATANSFGVVQENSQQLGMQK